MKLCHIFFCSIFLYLQDGNTGLANAETLIYEGVEGGNITVTCKFYIPGRKTFFCKEKCEKGNILIETADYTAQSGRYSIEYEKDHFLTPIVHVSITQLNKSDSGRYSCTLDTSFQPCDFQLVITGASDTPTPHEPLSTSTFLLSASTTPTTHFSSGSFTPSSTSPETLSSGSASDTPTPHEPLSTSTFLLSASTTTTTHFSSGSFTPSSTSPETLSSGSGLSLELVIRLSVVVVLLPVVLLLIYRITAEGSNGLNCKRRSAYDHTEIGLSEIDCPVSSCEDSTSSRDHDQTYSTLRHNNQFSDMNSCEAE
ncbi:cell wall integrity sensor MID2-like [Simochromis diagramma]|uniref:cell wall integrity sensor MID2-like n=1 Tax=Simochromis diagramma TaxID=43689 RepID=UPI001A7E7C35|nr:cell wall integrity sensor MID2-like [Simochromis diagramma]